MEFNIDGKKFKIYNSKEEKNQKDIEDMYHRKSGICMELEISDTYFEYMCWQKFKIYNQGGMVKIS